jgi:hypothetical protein
MKKLSLLFLLALVVSTLTSQTEEKVRKLFIEAGISGYLQADDSFFGGNVGFGYYVAPKHRLSLEIGTFSKNKEIGKFAYIVGTEGSSSYKYYDDGIISRDYYMMPLLFSWTYEVDFADKFRFQVGPSLGFTSISASDKYSPTHVNGVKIEGIPENRYNADDAVFTFGIGTGIRYRIFKISGISLKYRLFINQELKFENVRINTVSNQLSLTYWFNF